MFKYYVFILALLGAGCGVQVEGKEAETPTASIMTSTLPPSLTPPPSQTPLPPPPSPTLNPVEGVASTQVNVRSEPSTAGEVLGTLPPNSKVQIIGRDSNGAWLQIDFASGPDGKGWVNAAFVQATGAGTLPIVAEGNVIVGAGTPTITPLPASPTILPARADGDSAVAPAINITLTTTGTRSFQYSSDVSSPEGDAEDWMQFTTFTPSLMIELECEGSESYVADLLQNNSAMQNLVCGKIILISVDPQAVYAVHFQSSPAGGLQYTRFTLRVKAMP